VYLRDSCRICGEPVQAVFDLGETALANAFTTSAAAALALPRYPLVLQFCDRCRLGQLSAVVGANELFGHYFYATPPNASLARHYGTVLTALERLGVTGSRRVAMEMGSNNGEFMLALGGHFGRVIGVEPAENIAKLAQQRGCEVRTAFFGKEFAKRWDGPAVDLFVARHCIAHLDNLVEIAQSAQQLLSPDGVLYGENAYLGDTVEGGQFDQVYHEHMSYLSVTAVDALMRKVGLKLIHVERAALHGGSLLFFATRADSHLRTPDGSVAAALAAETRTLSREAMERFATLAKSKVRAVRARAKSVVDAGGTLSAYGATAKSNTLIAASGIGEWLAYCVDESPLKDGRFLPGGTPIVGRERFRKAPTGACLLTAWNYADEIRAKETWYQGEFINPGECR